MILNDTPIVEAITEKVAAYHLKELPASFVVVTPAWFKLTKAEQGGNAFPKWSGSIMPPPIGSQVYVNVWNEGSIGVSTVVDYYVEHGFLGVLVRPVKPPKGYAKRWKMRAPAAVAAGNMTAEEAAGPVTFHSMGCDLCSVEEAKARAKAHKAAKKLTSKVDAAVAKGKGYAVVGVNFKALAEELKNN
jgi:hypothetical protein